jgi:hypothetical protein
MLLRLVVSTFHLVPNAAPLLSPSSIINRQAAGDSAAPPIMPISKSRRTTLRALSLQREQSLQRAILATSNPCNEQSLQHEQDEVKN